MDWDTHKLSKLLAQKRVVNRITHNFKHFIKIALPVAAVLTTVGAWGYMIDVKELVNRIFVSDDDIAISENFEPPAQLSIGEAIQKKVRIDNLGDTDNFIRAKVVFSNESAAQFASIKGADSAWSERDELGWQYLGFSLQPSESSPPICESVQITNDASFNQLIDKSPPFEIYVISESVQAAGFGDAKEAFAAIGGSGGFDEQ